MVRSSNLIVILITATAVSASLGCGVKKDVHKRALDQIATLQGELDAANKELTHRGDRIDALEDELGATQAERDQKSAAEREKERKLRELLEKYEATAEDLENLRRQKEAADKRLAAYRQLNDKLRALVDTGKLKVSFRNGQMVLELPSGVLFPSARAKLSRDGETALAEVLDVLSEFKDRLFLVAGHTDNVPIRSRKFKNNWELSTARAVSVVQFMIEAGFDAKNLGAAGYGEFAPVAPNDSKENRALNRRIEIILVPDLSELPNLTEEP